MYDDRKSILSSASAAMERGEISRIPCSSAEEVLKMLERGTADVMLVAGVTAVGDDAVFVDYEAVKFNDKNLGKYVSAVATEIRPFTPARLDEPGQVPNIDLAITLWLDRRQVEIEGVLKWMHRPISFDHDFWSVIAFGFLLGLGLTAKRAYDVVEILKAEELISPVYRFVRPV